MSAIKTDNRPPIARFVEEWVNKSNDNINDIAVMAGFTHTRIIEMFMSGKARAPRYSPRLASVLTVETEPHAVDGASG